MRPELLANHLVIPLGITVGAVDDVNEDPRPLDVPQERVPEPGTARRPLDQAGYQSILRLIQSQLFGVSRMDPMTIAAVALVLSALALVACLVPAWRTTKLDPLLALRVE